MEYNAGKYDIVVIGGGHAGIEAALASARLGKKTAMFIINMDTLTNMPCNPSIGGTSKGHLVREIDALGGQMGKAADACYIQSKMLNSSKGPAVHSLRAQIDRKKYHMYMKNILEIQENLDIYQAEVTDIIYDKGIKGVKTKTGAIYNARAIIVTTGTYLKGKVIIGDVSYESGPDGVFPANKLSESLEKLGIQLRRFKTGTPARMNVKDLDLSKMEPQYGDDEIKSFSFDNEENIEILKKDQIKCYLTYTNLETHKVIKDNIHRSPLYSGEIKGIGPRYCPSIEDKVMRFKDKERHQIFIEPMGENTNEMYIQGMSSCLPEDVQIKMYRTVPGLENSKMMRPAYAIEYDCIDSTNLDLSLEYKEIPGLFFAGQINGSSGYEEAAAQGIIAGINATRKLDNKEPLILDRSEAYIGVLIDDLVTKGTNEPYRMMTSRSEYRLLLRQDNADLRLTEKGYEVGLVTEEKYNIFFNKKKQIEEEIERVKTKKISPNSKNNEILESLGSSRLEVGMKLAELLKRPELNYFNTSDLDNDRPNLPLSVQEQVGIQIKYNGYIKLQLEQIEGFKKLENRKLSSDIDYEQIKGLSLEARQKLNKQKPSSIGQASRISGVSPSDISVLLIYLNQIKKRGE